MSARIKPTRSGMGFPSRKLGLFESGVDYLEVFDEAHSQYEDRFIAIGPIRRGLVLVVWTERNRDIIRIISARWATRREQRLYHDHREEAT